MVVVGSPPSSSNKPDDPAISSRYCFVTACSGSVGVPTTTGPPNVPLPFTAIPFLTLKSLFDVVKMLS